MIIDSVAASAASIIAMAGDEITVARGATMMIHDPAAFTAGTSADHSKSIEMLETLAVSMSEIYAKRTGRKASEIREEMKEEIWMTGAEAVLRRYADKAEKIGIARNELKPAAFDYRLYAHAPERLVAMAVAEDWKMDPAAEAERQRSMNITAACAIAKQPDKAAALIASGKSLSEALATLTAYKAETTVVQLHNRPPVEVSAAASWDKVMADVQARIDAGISIYR